MTHNRLALFAMGFCLAILFTTAQQPPQGALTALPATGQHTGP